MQTNDSFIKKYAAIIRFLDNGYDLSSRDADSVKTLWQHFLDDFLIRSFEMSMREDTHRCHDTVITGGINAIANFLDEVFQRRPISFDELAYTNFGGNKKLGSLLDYMCDATNNYQPMWKLLLHKIAQIISKYYHQHCVSIKSEHLSMLLCLTVAQIPTLVDGLVDENSVTGRNMGSHKFVFKSYGVRASIMEAYIVGLKVFYLYIIYWSQL